MCVSSKTPPQCYASEVGKPELIQFELPVLSDGLRLPPSLSQAHARGSEALVRVSLGRVGLSRPRPPQHYLQEGRGLPGRGFAAGHCHGCPRQFPLPPKAEFYYEANYLASHLLIHRQPASGGGCIAFLADSTR